jgi:hypothetical protein
MKNLSPMSICELFPSNRMMPHNGNLDSIAHDIPLAKYANPLHSSAEDFNFSPSKLQIEGDVA